MGWRHEEFPRAFRYDRPGPRHQADDVAHRAPPRHRRPAPRSSRACRVHRLIARDGRAVGVEAVADAPRRIARDLTIMADHIVVCGGAVQTPALLQRSGLRHGIGPRAEGAPDGQGRRHACPRCSITTTCPWSAITEFAPSIAIGGSASRRGHLGLALADAGADPPPLLDDWEHRFVYYACIRSDAGGRVRALPGLATPLVTYRLTDADLSRLGPRVSSTSARRSSRPAPPSSTPRPPARRSARVDGRPRAVVGRPRPAARQPHDRPPHVLRADDASAPARAGVDSFGAVRGVENLRVSDASILPDAPGVNPQAAIMTIARRNADHFLADAL